MKHEWRQTIGVKRGQPRLTLWNRKLIEAGFPSGQPVTLTKDENSLTVIPDSKGTRKVLRVMNHGVALPVLEFLGKWIDHIGKPGTVVTVTVEPGKIKIYAPQVK